MRDRIADRLYHRDWRKRRADRLKAEQKRADLEMRTALERICTGSILAYGPQMITYAEVLEEHARLYADPFFYDLEEAFRSLPRLMNLRRSLLALRGAIGPLDDALPASRESLI